MRPAVLAAFVAVAAFAALASVVASAAEVPLGFDQAKPVASITVPDVWKPMVGAHGLEATAPDGTSSIIAKVIKSDEKEADAYNEETTAYIEEQGVTFPEAKGDAEPKTTDTDTKINGLDTFVSRLDEATTFKGAPTTLTYYAIPFGETATLNVITRGPKDDTALPAIVATIKPVN